MARHPLKAANLPEQSKSGVFHSCTMLHNVAHMEAVANRRSFHLRERHWIARVHVLSCQTLGAAQLRVFPSLVNCS